ncbi:MAG: amino acid permease [Chloroflexi bacterium]|nr:amino acid permease [Gemmatimonadota bacterium]MDA1009849.1 amino acid permease [Chloroflexota bacterium]
MSESLVRVLGFRDIVLIVVGTVIGSGIFIVPGAVLRMTGGTLGPALLIWALGGGLSLLGALTYAELGAMKPEAGGLYVYIRDAFGRLPAFLYGWTLFFVISAGAVATLAVAFGNYLGALVPMHPYASKAVALAMIAGVAWINVRGTRQGASVQVWTTALKAGAIVAISILFLVAGDGLQDRTAPIWPDQVTPPLLAGVGVAMIGTLWAYEGWHYVTFCAGETKSPQVTLPRGIIWGTLILIAIYLLANLGYAAALGVDGVAASDAVAADAMNALFGPGAAVAVTLIALVSMFSAANGITLSAPRVYYAMAQDGLFFRRLASVHPRFRTPAVAIGSGSAWAAVLALTGTFEQLLTYVIFIGWTFYALAAMAVFSYRRREPNVPRPFRVPGYPWVPAVFVLTTAVIVVNTVVTQPAQALLGFGVVLAGTPAYFVWNGRKRSVGD